MCANTPCFDMGAESLTEFCRHLTDGSISPVLGTDSTLECSAKESDGGLVLEDL